MTNVDKDIIDKITEQIMDINTGNKFENKLEAVFPGFKEYEKFANKKNYLICFVVPDRKEFNDKTESRLNLKGINYMVIFRWSGDVDITTSEDVTAKSLSIGFDFERWFSYALDLTDITGYQRKSLIECVPNIIYKENIIELFYRIKIEVIQ